MRRFLDKWGTAIAAVACALTIVFAAVYTRQDDLKRIAAQEARAAQDQSLQDAQAETVWARPVPSAPSEGFRGAYRDEHGLWRMQPYTRYPVAYGQSVTAVCAGEVLTVSADSLTYRCAGGETITCAGLSSVMVKIGDTLHCGQRVGMAARDAEITLQVRKGVEYLDLESLLSPSYNEPT